MRNGIVLEKQFEQALGVIVGYEAMEQSRLHTFRFAKDKFLVHLQRADQCIAQKISVLLTHFNTQRFFCVRPEFTIVHSDADLDHSNCQQRRVQQRPTIGDHCTHQADCPVDQYPILIIRDDDIANEEFLVKFLLYAL